MKYTMEQRGDMTVLHLAGKLGFPKSEELERELSSMLDRGRKRFVFDLSDVDFVTSDGLSMLLSLRARAAPLGGWVRIVCIRNHPYDIFRQTRLVEVFEVFEDLESALEEADA